MKNMGYNEKPTKGQTMQSVYSFLGSPLHLVLEDKIAEGYNRFIDAFAQAQINHEKNFGHKWQPEESIWMDITDEEQDAYEKVGRVINLLVEINGGTLEINEKQCTSDHLEKVETQK